MGSDIFFYVVASLIAVPVEVVWKDSGLKGLNGVVLRFRPGVRRCLYLHMHDRSYVAECICGCSVLI